MANYGRGWEEGYCPQVAEDSPPLLYGAMPRQDLQVGPDTITLPRAEVEALMEAASDAASELASIRHHIAAAIVKKALATLQERMK